jgi:peptide/nickel transport system ATP-binding protein
MNALLQLQGVSKSFARPQGVVSRLGARLLGRAQAAPVRALHTTELTLQQGEVVGLVGESGCGKSTLGRVAAGLHRSDTGERIWQGRPIDALQGRERLRCALDIQMVFQDPYASLNPRIPVGRAVGEAAVLHGVVSRAEAGPWVRELFRQVGLEAEWVHRFPHQFSGGQRARVGIARALSVQPRLLVCDESVAALDVSMQAQVLNLFMDLREQRGLTYLFISHDLGVVHHIADRVMVMYLGRIVESGATQELYDRPAHPYTQALLASVPRLDARKRAFIPLQGEIPSPLAPPSGCHFHPRCAQASDRCRQEAPAWTEIAPQHWAACHLYSAS